MYQGRGRGNNGKGRGFGRFGNKNWNNNNKNKNKERKVLSDYIYTVGTPKQASDYNKITEYLILHIKNNFAYGNDIGTALEKKEEYDMDQHKPTLQASQEQDADKKRLETEQFLEDYKIDRTAFINRKNTYATNKEKACALLIQQCNNAMKDRLQGKENWDVIKEDPIELLKAIKFFSTLSGQDKKYEPIVFGAALENLINLRQKEDENI